MTSFRTTIITAGLVLAVCTASLLESGAVAAENPHKTDKGATVAPSSIPPEVAAAIPADTSIKKTRKKKVIIKKKKRRKKRALAVHKTEQISSHVEKLTISQVMEALKTTRDLSGKNLSGLQLIGVNLSKCNLKGSDLNHANLERADLGEASLDRANLSGANLKMANLRLAGMPAANLELTTLDGAIWLDGRICAKGSSGECR